jgi:hypothetical protein
MHINRNLILGFCLLPALVGISLAWLQLSGSSDARSLTEEERLRARVDEFWECRLAGDGISIYELMEPRIAEHFTKTEFAGTQAHNRYYSYRIEEIEINGDVATVTVEYEWMIKLGEERSILPKNDRIRDTWLRIDGEWYRQYRKPRLPTSR